MGKLDVVMEVVLLLQGTPVADFARDNFLVQGDRALVRCAASSELGTAAGETCKRSVATALRRYSYRFSAAQLSALAELYVNALNALEPDALPRVREHMCNPDSEAAQRDATAAQAVCERLSLDF